MNGAATLKAPRCTYLMSIAGPGSGNQKRQLARSMDGVGAANRVIKLREHAWKYEPSEIHIKRGEVVTIEYSATDNGLGRAAALLDMTVPEVKNRATVTGAIEIGRHPGVVQVTFRAPVDRLEARGLLPYARESYSG